MNFYPLEPVTLAESICSRPILWTASGSLEEVRSFFKGYEIANIHSGSNSVAKPTTSDALKWVFQQSNEEWQSKPVKILRLKYGSDKEILTELLKHLKQIRQEYNNLTDELHNFDVIEATMKTALSLPQDKITAFCTNWQIAELSLFGSILRDDFRPDSDIDLLVTFSPEADWGLFDHVQMQHDLQEILGRDVDLVSKRAIENSENWIRRQEILSTAKVIYVQP